MCKKLLHVCIFFIIYFIILVYVFVFQNIIIEERNCYVFAIFRDSQLVFVHLKKTILFIVLYPILFDPCCQPTNYSWATILSWRDSPRMVWSWRFPSSETLSSAVILFLLLCDDDTRLWLKSSEICFLSLSPFNSFTTWQDDRSKFSWQSISPTSSGMQLSRMQGNLV